MHILNPTYERSVLLLPLGCWLLSLVAYFTVTACDSLREQPVRELTPAAQLCNGGTASLAAIQDLPAPPTRKEIGNAHLIITTASPAAQQWFDRGLDYLHGFWYLEAYRAFRRVTELDPDCAMGYWGIAMCQPGFGGDDWSTWKEAIAKASLLGGVAGKPVEQALIQALRVTASDGLVVAAPAWREVADEQKDQPDALAIAGLMLRQTVRTDAESDEVKHLLEQGLERFPDHVGLLHYYVHAMEVRPDFAEAEDEAERLVQNAPGTPHLTHMPGHLHYLAGRYAEAVAVFEAARAQEEAYHAAEDIPYGANQNYLHNLHYLAVAYSELGEQEKALEAARAYASVTLRQTAPVDGAGWMLLYQGRMLPALVHLRFGEYATAAREIDFWLATPVAPLEDELVREYMYALSAYCQAMQLATDGERERAMDYADLLVNHLARFNELASQSDRPAELELAAEVYDVMDVARYELAGWLNNLDPAEPFYDEDWRAGSRVEAALPYDEPPRLMYPLAESRARLHLWRGEAVAAREAMDDALRRRPKSPIIEGLLATL